MKKFLSAIAFVTFGFALGYLEGRHSLGLLGTANPGQALLPQESGQAGAKLGPWTASFRLPGSVQMPDKSPVVKCAFKAIKFSYMYVTITNLTSRPYLVTYNLYGYDAKGRRVSDGHDQFTIGGHESVARKVMLLDRAEGFFAQFGRTFSVQMTLEE